MLISDIKNSFTSKQDDLQSALLDILLLLISNQTVKKIEQMRTYAHLTLFYKYIIVNLDYCTTGSREYRGDRW